MITLRHGEATRGGSQASDSPFGIGIGMAWHWHFHEILGTDYILIDYSCASLGHICCVVLFFLSL